MWSKNFDERPHHSGADLSWGKVNVTPAGWEHCSELSCQCWDYAGSEADVTVLSHDAEEDPELCT